MTLQSMTGFARASGQHGEDSWVWELRSVNGKGLDLRLRIPSGFDGLETAVRKRAGAKLNRGNIQISLQMQRAGNSVKPVINHDALEALRETSAQLQKKLGGEMPSVAELLAIKGVVEMEEASLDEKEQAALETAIIASFEVALDSLVSARCDEGQAVAAFLGEQVDAIESLRLKIAQDTDRTPDAIRERLRIQVEKLVTENENFEQQRLHQEAALLAAKADIQEELDRLEVHLAAARQLLAGEGPCGRKLDFLSQEFNRECNTICSKSNSASVSALGLDMKHVIDQFREQIQNME